MYFYIYAGGRQSLTPNHYDVNLCMLPSDHVALMFLYICLTIDVIFCFPLLSLTLFVFGPSTSTDLPFCRTPTSLPFLFTHINFSFSSTLCFVSFVSALDIRAPAPASGGRGLSLT